MSMFYYHHNHSCYFIPCNQWNTIEAVHCSFLQLENLPPLFHSPKINYVDYTYSNNNFRQLSYSNITEHMYVCVYRSTVLIMEFYYNLYQWDNCVLTKKSHHCTLGNVSRICFICKILQIRYARWAGGVRQAQNARPRLKSIKLSFPWCESFNPAIEMPNGVVVKPKTPG